MSIHTYNRQVQTVSDVIGGQAPLIPLQELAEPFTFILEWVQEAPTGQVYSLLASKKKEEPDLVDIIDDIIATSPGDRVTYKSLNQIETPPTEFLWEGWIPRGEMTLLVASPGAGKTYALLDLYRRIVHQKTAPDGSNFDLPDGVTNNVILVDAENYLPAIKERVSAWGMNIEHLYPMEKPVRGLIDLSEITYQRQLADMVDALRPALVAVDSLSRVNSRGENNIEDLREVLDFLTAIPGSFGCGLILVHHLRKRNSRQTFKNITIDDIRGTGDLIAAARSVIAIDPLPSNKNARRMSSIKINEGERPDPLGFQFVSLEHAPRIARLDYQDLAALTPQIGPTKVEQCSDWLCAVLQDGPLSMRELMIEGGKAGFDISSLQRARAHLNDDNETNTIVDTVGHRKSGNKWALKHEE